jgi:hypothetical protein
MSRSYKSSPLYASIDVLWDCFTLLFGPKEVKTTTGIITALRISNLRHSKMQFVRFQALSANMKIEPSGI